MKKRPVTLFRLTRTPTLNETSPDRGCADPGGAVDCVQGSSMVLRAGRGGDYHSGAARVPEYCGNSRIQAVSPTDLCSSALADAVSLCRDMEHNSPTWIVLE